LRGKFSIRKDYVYKMPVHFGGEPFVPVRTVYGDMTTICVKFETDQEALLKIIPEDFELLEPVVNVQYANCREVDWMSGGEYRLIQLSSPVRYTGNPEGLEGQYALVIWENKACPIIGGREEDGMPKVFADIASERHSGEHWFTSASYECNTFLTIDLERKEELGAGEIAELNEHSRTNVFGWRYIPNMGKGGASLSHATLYPQEAIARQAWIGEGCIKWYPLTLEQNLVQFRIISTLANLPVIRYLPAKMMKGSSRLNVGDSRPLP